MISTVLLDVVLGATLVVVGVLVLIDTERDR